MADRIEIGWELFAERVDSDLARSVLAVHDDPDFLGKPLAGFPSTLLHGDAKLENLGLGQDGLVAIDWGDLTGVGPAEIDVAWYALKGAVRIGCTPDEIFSDYERAANRRLDPVALDLACLGSLAQMGFRFAVSAFGSGPDPRDTAAAQLEWWTARARAALERVSLL